MTDYYDDNDNEAWDGQTDGIYDPDDWEEEDEFDCGMVDDKRLCADAGTESCSFFCPFHSWVMERNPDDLPMPPDFIDDIPF